jgi:hypothetical protein
VWAFLTPTEESDSDPASYEQTGAFGYTAATVPGPAYGGHRIRTGDTVFLRLARELEVWFQYRLRADGRHESFGSIALAAELRDDSGWERTLPLTVRAFRGDSAEIRHRLQPTLLNRIVQRARIQTGVTGGSVELALVARVRAAGTLHGAPLASEFTSRLRFGLDALSLRPLAAESDALARKSGTVPVIDERATRLALGPLTVEGARVRAGSASLALLALLALGIVSYSRLGAPPAREIDRIRARHRSLLVPVAGRLTPLTQPLVEVATWEALRRIAEVVQSPILDDCSSSPTLTVLTQEAAYVLRPCLAPEQTRQASLEPSRRGSGTVGYPVEETDLSVANPSTRANSRIRKRLPLWRHVRPR